MVSNNDRTYDLYLSICEKIFGEFHSTPLRSYDTPDLLSGKYFSSIGLLNIQKLNNRLIEIKYNPNNNEEGIVQFECANENGTLWIIKDQLPSFFVTESMRVATKIYF